MIPFEKRREEEERDERERESNRSRDFFFLLNVLFCNVTRIALKLATRSMR